MAILIGMSESIKGRKFDVDAEDVAIGRKTSNMIILDEASVSGSHCRMRKNGGIFTIEDVGSTNGTRVNGRPIKTSRLNPKDIVQVGNLELMIDGDDIEAEPMRTEGTPTTRIEVFNEPARVPNTFQTASPFGTRHGRHGHLWSILIAVIGFVALVALIYTIVKFIR